MQDNRTIWLTIGTVAATLVGLAMVVLPTSADRDGDDWLDALTNAVLIERRGGGGYPGVVWEPYLGQIQIARTHFERGDVAATYRAMNRFMDMLEAREGGISNDAAEAIWDYCYQVTPAMYHDVSQHLRADRKVLEKIKSYSPPPME